MPKFVVIDCETSGLHVYAKKGEPPIPADAPGQPRLCGVTFIPVNDLLEPDGGEITTLIKPNGEWEITPEVHAIHGLTTEQCQDEGLPVEIVLDAYEQMIRDGRIVVSFNAQFDTKIMRGELRRAGRDDLFKMTKNICCMRGSTGLGIVKAGDKKGGFPKLSDVYRHFYGAEPEGQHTSLGDARTCLAIFRKLVEIGKAPEAAVHYSSTRKD